MAKKKKKRKTGLREIPDVLWEKLVKIIPQYKISSKGGRPRADLRKIMNGILYVLRTGCQWKMVPKEFGTGSTCHRYFQEWEKVGVFKKLWQIMVIEYDEKRV